MSIRLVSAIAALSLLTSCGFHLRGNIELPPELSKVYISGPDRELVEELSDALEQSGASVVKQKAGAAHINMTEANFETDVTTTDSDGRATGYNFTYRVVYNATSANGDRLQSSEKFTQSRTIDYSPEEQLQAEKEGEFLKEEMQRELVVQMLRRLARI
jgi:LPS-assembly lipoprotein